MATYVTKDDVKSFVKDVVKRLNADHDSKYVTHPAVNTVKGDLDTLEDRVAQINTENFVSVEAFEDKLNNRLEELAEQTNDTFTAEDVEDVFS